MPEETKPVEREAFEKWAASKPISADTSGFSFAQAGWDAALERAAQTLAEEVDAVTGPTGGWLVSPLKLKEEFRDALRALKGSR